MTSEVSIELIGNKNVYVAERGRSINNSEQLVRQRRGAGNGIGILTGNVTISKLEIYQTFDRDSPCNNPNSLGQISIENKTMARINHLALWCKIKEVW